MLEKGLGTRKLRLFKVVTFMAQERANYLFIIVFIKFMIEEDSNK